MLAGFVLFLLAAMAGDFTRRRVPNGLVLLGALGAVAAGLLGLQPWSLSGGQIALGGLLGLAGLLPFYALGHMGAGDVKFASALGLWVGPGPLLAIWIGASLLGALHALLWLLLQRWSALPRLALALSGRPSPAAMPTVVPPAPTSSPDSALRPAARARHVPLAAYLAIAALGWMAWQRAA